MAYQRLPVSDIRYSSLRFVSNFELRIWRGADLGNKPQFPARSPEGTEKRLQSMGDSRGGGERFERPLIKVYLVV